MYLVQAQDKGLQHTAARQNQATWVLENGNKTWNLIGNFLQETDSEHPMCPSCSLEIQLWPKPDRFYWTTCPDLPLPFHPLH